MAKQSGLASALFVGTADVSGDISTAQMETMRATLTSTALDKSAEERMSGLRDGSITYTAYWNTAALQAHAVLSLATRADQITSLYIGASVGFPTFSVYAKQITYAPTRGQDGSLVANVNALANGFPGEWGEMLTTGKQTFATGTVLGTSIDLGAVSTSFGSAAYLQCFSVGSGTSTFTITDSADNITFGTTLHTFTAVTGATTERLQGAVGGTVRRYVRLEKTGVSTSTVVAVTFVRYTETTAT